MLVRARGENPWRGFFSGYLKNAAANAETLAGDWLHTGDVVRIGPDGSMYFVDRRKNVIRRSGENISALEVEAVLSECELVDNAVVCPVPDEIRGDEVFATIVLSPAHESGPDTAAAVFEHCMQALAYYKAPGYIAFATSLPLTASGKPQRGELKQLSAGRVEAGDCFDLRERKRGSSKAKSA